jgi:transposase InsO family protein
MLDGPHLALPRTRDEARAAVHDYIEVFYNRERRHSTIGNISPVECEARYHGAVDNHTA